jgi:hypothetical protein
MLTEFFTFKLYYFLCGPVFVALDRGSAAAIGRSSPTSSWIGPSVAAGTGAWIAATVAIIILKRSEHSAELGRLPLAWSRSATSAATFFLLSGSCLLAPLLDFHNPLPITMFALLGVSVATGGIALYLSHFLVAGRTQPYRSVEALKAEQQVWTIIFNGSVVWVGVFIGGAVLSASLGAAGDVLKNTVTGIPQETVEGIILYHACAAAWAGVGAILWILRPVHRRLFSIARDIDALVDSRLNIGLQPTAPEARKRRRG